MSQDDGDGYDPYDDVPEWTDEDEERYQARQQEDLRRRRRRRRQGVSFAVIVLLVLGAGVAGAGINQGWWEWPFGQDGDTAAESCPEGVRTISSPGEVQVRVLNATDVAGLAGAVGAELERRGYVVTAVGNDEDPIEVLEGAQVRHGPGLLGEARSVAVNFRGAVLIDDGRTGDVVDVAVGAGYRRMTPAEEAAATIAAAAPTPPAGCTPSTPSPSPTG